jgi:hypothetical protein
MMVYGRRRTAGAFYLHLCDISCQFAITDKNMDKF